MTVAGLPTVVLNDDNTIPVLGFGVGELSEAEAEQSTLAALEAGYRLIDTAAAYGNEAAVGRAIARSGVAREELFVTTKLAAEDLGFQSAQDSLRASLERLGLEYVDLYLIHWPAGAQGKYVDSWGGMMKSKEVGLTRSIGVSNFAAHHLDDVISLSFFTPAINQVELHPLLNQAELRAFDAEHGIVTAAYGAFGAGHLLTHAAVTEIAAAQGRTPAQVLLRWSLQLGNVVISHATDPQQMAENLDVFGFELTDEQMATLNGLDEGTRFGPDPETYAAS